MGKRLLASPSHPRQCVPPTVEALVLCAAVQRSLSFRVGTRFVPHHVICPILLTHQSKRQDSLQGIVTRCTYYERYTTDEALQKAAESYGGLT